MPQADILVTAEAPTYGRIPLPVMNLIDLAPLPGIDQTPVCAQTEQRVVECLTTMPELRGSVAEAALWLLAGQLDQSHIISQNLETSDGAYWHGIMHRREGDFGNANYWFRRAGKHPVYSHLSEHLERNQDSVRPFTTLPDLYNATKVAEAITDGCRDALEVRPENIAFWRSVCWLEWQFLFLHCWNW